MYGPPPPLGLSRPSRNETRYHLKVVQNPVHARCCGFGEKDRRLVDPPAILQLFEETDDGRIVRVTDVDSTLFVVHCDLYCENKKEPRSLVYLPSTVPPEPSGLEHGIFSLKEPKYVRNLTGTLTANANHLVDDKKQPGIFFIFHDLSVRTDGWFTLKFMFMDLGAGEPFTMSTGVKAETFSEPFRVYTAKKFPGMTESTSLSKAFAKQGIKIVIRRDSSFSRASDKYYKMALPGQKNATASSSSSQSTATSSGPSSSSASSSVTTAQPTISATATTTTLATSSSSVSIRSLTLANNVDPIVSSPVSFHASTTPFPSSPPGQSPMPYTRIAIADVLSAAPDDSNNEEAASSSP